MNDYIWLLSLSFLPLRNTDSKASLEGQSHGHWGGPWWPPWHGQCMSKWWLVSDWRREVEIWWEACERKRGLKWRQRWVDRTELWKCRRAWRCVADMSIKDLEYFTATGGADRWAKRSVHLLLKWLTRTSSEMWYIGLMKCALLKFRNPIFLFLGPGRLNFG